MLCFTHLRYWISVPRIRIAFGGSSSGRFSSMCGAHLFTTLSLNRCCNRSSVCSARQASTSSSVGPYTCQSRSTYLLQRSVFCCRLFARSVAYRNERHLRSNCPPAACRVRMSVLPLNGSITVFYPIALTSQLTQQRRVLPVTSCCLSTGQQLPLIAAEVQSASANAQHST